ncbi:MAG TPA: DUF1707 domain-containing protein [Amycolatopsis sp.]|nr:DUF1707 domain-containing protein [Amycolatopsis sp.]
MNESPDVRIGDVDREQALGALGEHLSAGRLDVDEYGERSARVTAARTRGELTAIFTDLPQPHPGAPKPAVENPPPRPNTPVTWSDRPLAQRLTAALIPVLFLGAIVAGITTGVWWFIAVPFVVGALGRSMWGQDWDRDRQHGRDRERHRRREIRDR